MTRSDGRKADELRSVRITPGFLEHPAGSCVIQLGKTKVICSAMIEESVPPFLKGSGTGWLTAEYSMLPGSSGQRISRERSKLGGRTQEIQRLIGRSLRACLDLKLLGERSVLIDCDVLDADGGTRTASITGAYVALQLALRKWETVVPGISRACPRAVAAVSVGIIDGVAMLDLHYDDDKRADVDMNIVKTSTDEFVEVQGTAEQKPFSQKQLDALLSLASRGISDLLVVQQQALE